MALSTIVRRNIVGSVPDEVVKLLKQGPATHLQQHAYAYVRVKATTTAVSLLLLA